MSIDGLGTRIYWFVPYAKKRIRSITYKYIATANDDDGWLLGGGEPSDSPQLPAKDSAHIEIMRLGIFVAALGGISSLEIDNLLMSVRMPVLY